MRIRLWLLLVFLIMGGARVTFASAEAANKESLKGLKGVAVVIENLEPEVEQAGLTEASIQTDVELKLRQVGIPVLTDADGPFLAINTPIYHDSSGIWSFGITVELHQRVFLARNPAIGLFTSTWSVESIGSTGKNNVRKLRDYIKDEVD